MTKRTKQLIGRAASLISEISELKEKYRELDVIVDKLVDAGFTEATIGRRVYKLHDNYASKNHQWKSTAFRRFELVIERKQ